MMAPTIWGDTAPSVRRTPTTSTDDGVDLGWPSSVTLEPGGLVAKVRVDVRGTTSTNMVSVRPPESRTVRWMRYHTFAEVSPVVGMTKEPVLAPLVGGTKGWKWVSWWKSTHQVKALGGRLPFSKSVPVPE